MSIFIEQFPSELFNDKVLEILFEIGKETIKNLDKINIERENFVDMILLNEKIIINYDVKKRMILWKILYLVAVSTNPGDAVSSLYLSSLLKKTFQYGFPICR